MKTYSNIGIASFGHNPETNQIAVIRFASGKHEPVKIGGTTRTNNIIRRQQANERVYDTNAKLLGLDALERANAQRSEEKKARRARFKAERNLKNR